MKIIEYGHIKPKEIKCIYCGAILEYTSGDLEKFRDNFYLECPICHMRHLRDNDGNKFTKEA